MCQLFLWSSTTKQKAPKPIILHMREGKWSKPPWPLPHSEGKPEPPWCSWEDLPAPPAQVPPSSPVAISYLEPPLPAASVRPRQEHAPAPGHFISPLPQPSSAFPQKYAWLTYSWPTPPPSPHQISPHQGKLSWLWDKDGSPVALTSSCTARFN